MSVMQKEISVAAGATVENVFSGSAFEFARGRQVISMGVTQSATGMLVTINNGVDVVAEEFSPNIKTIYPVIPDEFYYNTGAVQGDRLVMRVRNPTAGALTVRAIAQITPV